MDKVQIRILKDLRDNKKEYLDICKKQKNYKTIVDMYEDFDMEYKLYLDSLTTEVFQRTLYQKELKSRKIDPYIAGGIANGIAGIGAGIYSATTIAENNSIIDYNRKALQNSVSNISSSTSRYETRLLNISMKLYNLLIDTKKIRTIMEETIETTYNSCKESMEFYKKDTMMYEQMGKIAEDFESLGDYKDSKLLAQKCYSLKNKNKWIYIMTLSLIPSIILAIIEGFCAGSSAGASVGASVGIFICFPVNYIGMLVYCWLDEKKKHNSI